MITDYERNFVFGFGSVSDLACRFYFCYDSRTPHCSLNALHPADPRVGDPEHVPGGRHVRSLHPLREHLQSEPPERYWAQQDAIALAALFEHRADDARVQRQRYLRVQRGHVPTRADRVHQRAQHQSLRIAPGKGITGQLVQSSILVIRQRRFKVVSRL